MSSYILIKTDQQNKLEQALYDLANLYSSSEDTEGIQLYRKKGLATEFLIRFSNQPDFVGFSYYVNYLDYPIGLDEFSFKVYGFYNSSQLYEFSKLKNSGWLMIYTNPKDEYGDNVYIVNESNKTFIYDFGGNLTEIDKSVLPYKLVSISQEDYHHITDIYPAPKDKADKKLWWKFW
ncbi:hypothetical protein LY01_01596 [Nonlabens xylanidelens]|uniref:Uncharacterized protein n=1 Tax=Nonlabens xylanidelens TaxID=191564 RepID=A0A2S6IKT5_9FLAO|nr:hypothetical protein [Nonlabens xylanidelens]PPK94843.1 hypothetical protein LY01_01596 [Nonlabens xylanidelens]PQJ17396.1 hypothetical protein BST94_10060 [Nonlabens xylanidelens]